jgi:hypothetical protein
MKITNAMRFCLALCGFGVGCGSVSGGQVDSGSSMVTIDVVITGAGTVTSSPAGVTCAPDCTLTVARGTPVTLTAATGTLLSWGGACSGTADCELTATDDIAVAANFDVNETLTVSMAGDSGSTIMSTPAGISCPPTCTADFPRGSMVTLAFSDSDRAERVSWGGSCVGTGACAVLLDAPKTVTGNFFTFLIDTAPTPILPSPRVNGGGTVDISAAAATVITELDVDIDVMGAATQVKFVIFDGTSLGLLFVSAPVAAPLGRGFVQSPPMSFTMNANQKYQIGAVVAGSANFEFDATVTTVNGLTTYGMNGNPTSFASPTLPASFGGDDAHVQIYGHPL